MSALALDIGFTCGWARSDGRSGVQSFLQPDHGEALAMFSDWIDAMLDETPLVYLAIEQSFFGGVPTSRGRITMQMTGIAHAAAWARDIPRVERSADQVRKFLLGFARISKKTVPSKIGRTRQMDSSVLAAVRARGFYPDDEHAADACGLLACVEGIQPRQVAA